MNASRKKELEDPKSGVSSMRWAVLQLIPVVKWMLIAIPFILSGQLYFHDSVDWSGASMYVAALGVFVTALLGTKAYQKSKEQQ